jgi:hypothetical protein
MVFTPTMKERRLVLGGGVRGAAVKVMLRVALPPPPQFTVQVFGTPLHEIKVTADSKIGAAKTLRKFIEPPRQSARPSLSARLRHQRPKHYFIACLLRRDAKGEQLVQLLNAAARNR